MSPIPGGRLPSPACRRAASSTSAWRRLRRHRRASWAPGSTLVPPPEPSSPPRRSTLARTPTALRSTERGRRATPARLLLVTAGAAALLGAALLGALCLGVEHVDLGRAWADPASIDAAILVGARLSRALLGLAVRAALAAAGVAFPALLRNPLADPYVLGISGGASVAGTAAIVLGAATGRL